MGVLDDRTVLRFGVGDLRHQPEHGEATRGRQIGERIERSAHAGGVGVVTVVEHGGSAHGSLQLHSHGGEADVGERRCALLQVAADCAHTSERCRGVVRHVAATDAEVHLALTPGGEQPERRAGDLVEVQVGDAHVGAITIAVKEHRSGGDGAHRSHPEVVDVEQREAVGGQRCDQLRLRSRDAFDATHALTVRLGDACHDADGGPRNGAQLGDLTEPAHAHLQHQHLGELGGVEQRGR